MSDRSFIESWSLNVDDIAFVEGFNLVSRVWVAFQLRFFQLSWSARWQPPRSMKVGYCGRNGELCVVPRR